MLKFGLFKTIRILTILVVCRYPKRNFKKNFQGIGCPSIKCAYQAFIFQNLDVLTFELGMKVCDLLKY
jgi:hypothetical protein